MKSETQYSREVKKEYNSLQSMSAEKTILGILALSASVLMPVLAHAQVLHITPSLIESSSSVEEALETHKSHASTTVSGQGGTLTITYQSGEPLEVYMVPMNEDDTYVPTDYVRFTLPLTTEGTVSIDLTRSPGWSQKNIKWLISLLGKDENTDAAFTDIRFSNEGAPNLLSVGLRHLLTPEAYTPSSYHALRGYRMLGSSLTRMLGVFTVIVTLFLFAAAGNKTYRHRVLFALIAASLLYQARFAIDLLRFTGEHTAQYAQGTYDEAGSIHAVSDVLRTLAKEPAKTTVYVCRDGTNFKEKLLRYFTYPIRISSESGAAKTADYALVMNTFKWGYQTNITKDTSIITLKCGEVSGPAQKLTTFPSGEILFKLLPAATKS